jgi:hypothetical protein
MARFLLSLTLLLTLLRSEYVQAACYASSWVNGMPVYGSLFVDGGTTLAQCQALACQIYPSISPSCPQPCQQETQTQVLSCPSGYNGTITQTKTKTCPANVWGDWITSSNTCVSTCVQVSETQTQSCPVNFNGQITQTRIKTCPDNQWQAWTTTQNTCVANPPTCQISSQQQTLQCQTGFTGSITQTRSSTCPDPYGSPTWLPWATTSDTCKKSINNPTNPTSPVSPLSPASNTSAPTIQSSPVTVSTPNTAPNSVATPTETPSMETKSAPTQEKSATSEAAPTSASATTTASPTTSTTQATPIPPVPKGKTRSVVGLVLSLELFQKPGIQQANVFPDLSIVKGIPNEILTQDLIMMDLLQQPSYNQPFDAPDLGFEQ